MIYKVHHRTRLTYESAVSDARLNLRLRPVDWPGQRLARFDLAIAPEPSEVRQAIGPYLVNLEAVAFEGEMAELTVVSDFRIEVAPPPLRACGATIADVREHALASCDLSAYSPVPYLFGSRISLIEPEIAEWASDFLPYGDNALEGARRLASAIHAAFAYDPGITTSQTPPIKAFHDRRGVCQDFAHVMIAGLRGHGVPAAYVSGYLRTEPPPGMERLVGADAMHAWVAVWCGEDCGWVGIDPTNDCLARESHIVVAMGRDYADIAPIDGVFIGAAPQRMRVEVDVLPID